MSLNRVELIGNLTKDPEVRQFQNGNEMASFSVATNRTYKTEDGEKKDIPEYHNLVVFGKLVDIVSKYLRKGSKVWIEGRLQTRSWETKDGDKRYTTEIVMQELIMLSSKREQSPVSENEMHEENDERPLDKQEAELDDLPF